MLDHEDGDRADVVVQDGRLVADATDHRQDSGVVHFRVGERGEA